MSEEQKAAMPIGAILHEWLKERGYDGLVNTEIPCGCELSNLAPCGAPDFLVCQAGYKHCKPKTGERQWAIWTQKEPPTEEQWRELDSRL